jgi:hypothetical protein
MHVEATAPCVVGELQQSDEHILEQRRTEPSVFVVTVDAKASEQCDRLRGPAPLRNRDG